MNGNGTHEVGAIRPLRAAAGMSQEALARAADCSTTYIRVLERGYRPRPGAEAPVLARVLAALDKAQTYDERRPAESAAVKTPGGPSRHGTG
jgi:transcriptional regulator with XRE-family HTH domain